jgi:hypothetical protein
MDEDDADYMQGSDDEVREKIKYHMCVLSNTVC